MVPRPQTSAAGVLALLDEPEPLFKQHALKTLNPLVPQFWAEISEHIATIEALYEDSGISKEARNLAALLASKVYYFLGEYDEALSFALGAGAAFQAEFQIPESEEYIETITSKAVDHYIQTRANTEGGTVQVDNRLQSLIEDIFARCIEEGSLKQAIGIALESHRLDVVSRIFDRTKDTDLLAYAMEAILDTGFTLSYRDQVLNFLFPLFPPLTAQSPHIHSFTRLIVSLSNASITISVFTSLVPKETLIAFQLAFDLAEGGSQEFLNNVREGLPKDEGSEQETFETIKRILTGEESIKLYLDFLKRSNKVDLLILKNTKDSLEARSSVYHTAVSLSNAFMHSGTASDQFLRENLEWLGRASNWSKFSATAALGVINKGNLEHGMELLGPYLPGAEGGSTSPGGQYQEGGALYALGLVNAGHGSGQPVETYLIEKLKGATQEPIQHGAALGLGMAGFGSGNLAAYEALKETLYSDSAVAGEAAGLAMGLVMLGRPSADIKNEMLLYAHETQHEKIIRGLAVSMAFLYYARQEEADGVIRDMCSDKDPIIRYGGVYTLALAYVGTSNNNAIRKLLHIAVSDTSDDVRRAAVTSLSFLLFKNPSQVPRMVQLLSESYNPHVRCGATLALGIACAGTGFQDAVDILEPMTKDPVDFVRQGALMALGMILVQQTDASSPSLGATRSMYAKIISDKHEDPMARFGAVLGQGFIDAGGRNVTISLQSMVGSSNTSSIIGMALFCQFWYWYPLAHCACLAFTPTAVIGLNQDLKPPRFDFVSNARPSMFAYPAPTKPPTKEAVEKVATAVLSTTAKAKAREKEKAKEHEKKEGSDMEADEKAEEKADTTEDTPMKENATEPPIPRAGDISPIAGSMSNLTEAVALESETKPPAKPAPKRREPSSETLPNFSRVTPAQMAHITFPAGGRYQPVRSLSSVPSRNGAAGKGARARAASSSARGLSSGYAGGGGILLLLDSRPHEEAELIEFKEEDIAMEETVDPVEEAGSATLSTMVNEGPEAEPPEPFEYQFDNDT